jgi:hypothetical protein
MAGTGSGKLTVKGFVLTTLCLSLWFFSVSDGGATQGVKQGEKPQQPEIGTREALKQDLVSSSGEKVLEITQAFYTTTAAGLDSSSVQVRNVSGKNITALGIVWTVTFTDGKTCRIEQLVNYSLHKDIVDAKSIRPFAPFEEKFIPRLTKDVFDEGQAIGNLKVGFSFVEFEGSGGVGLETSEMYEGLLAQREGARLYKRWVESGYGDNPGNIGGVIGKLSGDDMPAAKELENEKAKQGAALYRQWLLGVLKDSGEDNFREQMQRQTLGRK